MTPPVIIPAALLEHLRTHDNPRTLDLAAHFGASQATVIKYLHQLRGEGLIEYETFATQDGHRSVIRVTEYGRTAEPGHYSVRKPSRPRQQAEHVCGPDCQRFGFCFNKRNQNRRQAHRSGGSRWSIPSAHIVS